jgi:hypothetical protein
VLIDTIIEHFDVATDERFTTLAEKVGNFLDDVGNGK